MNRRFTKMEEMNPGISNPWSIQCHPRFSNLRLKSGVMFSGGSMEDQVPASSSVTHRLAIGNTGNVSRLVGAIGKEKANREKPSELEEMLKCDPNHDFPLPANDAGGILASAILCATRMCAITLSKVAHDCPW